MTIGLAVIPMLVEKIGIERFGILSIAWMLVGYFGILDMGLGRALTYKVAQSIGQNKTENIKSLVWGALLVISALGILGTLILSGITQHLVYDTFNLSTTYQQETAAGIYWLSLAIPLTIMSTGLIGVLEGQQRFDWTAAVKTPSAILMFVAPLLATALSPSLEWALASLFFVRLLTCVALIFVTHSTLKAYPTSQFDWTEFKSMLSFSGWLTVSNIVSPAMVYFDRFYIASVLSTSVVAFYTIPFDLLIKVLVIPFALVSVMFTVFSTDWKEHKKRVIDSYHKSVLIVFMVMLPFVIINYFIAKQGLSLWISPEFAEKSYQITQVIAIGFFLNAMSAVPFALIQGMGRADLTAKFHLLEMPLYILSLWYFVDKFGLAGAAYAWILRAGLDCSLLYVAAFKLTRSKEIEITPGKSTIIPTT